MPIMPIPMSSPDLTDAELAPTRASRFLPPRVQ